MGKIMQRISHDRYKIFWTGWKKHICRLVYAGQWFAFDPDNDGVVLFSGAPGPVGILKGVDVYMDLAIQPDQILITDATPTVDREFQKALALAKFMAFLEVYENRKVVHKDPGGGDSGRSIQVSGDGREIIGGLREDV
jgi:hypothetical protein